MVVPDFPSKSLCVTAEFSFNTFLLICAPTFLFLLAVNHLIDRCNYSVSVRTAEVKVNDISLFSFLFFLHSTYISTPRFPDNDSPLCVSVCNPF